MFKFLQDVVIKLLQDVVEQLPGTEKNDEERLGVRNSSNYIETNANEELYNVLETSEVSTPVAETQETIRENRSYMPSRKIYNRKVYMLIDQSGSMARRDALFNNERRWKAIAEAIEGHVYNILNHQGMNGEKICDEITMTFFSPNAPCPVIRSIYDDSEVQGLFEENQPDSNTFITPTFQQIVDRWFSIREPNQGGFIIIYTDGALDDRDAFVNYIETTCGKLTYSRRSPTGERGILQSGKSRPQF